MSLAPLTPLLLVCMLLPGCPAPRPTPRPNPAQVLGAYVEALRAGDWSSAYGLMEPGFHAACGEEDFQSRFFLLRAELLDRLVQVQAEASAPPRVSATFAPGSVWPVVLLSSQGLWFMDASLLEIGLQSTPRQTVRSFVFALRQRRYDLLRRLMPSAYRSDLDSETLREHLDSRADSIAALCERLQEHLGDPIEVRGDRAMLRHGRDVLTMRREAGDRWVIVDTR